MAIKEEVKIRILVNLGNNVKVSDIALRCGVSLSTVYRIKNSSADFIKDYLATRELIARKKYKAALEICNKDKWQNNGVMQYRKIDIFILERLKRYDEALAICNLDEWQDNGPIQNKKVKILIEMGELEEALGICNQEKWKDYNRMQYQKAIVLMKMGRLKAALEVCSLEKWQNNEEFQVKKVDILMELGRYKEALAVCNLDRWQKNMFIQYRKVKILIELGRLEEALAICDLEKCQKDGAMQKQKSRIINIMASGSKIDEKRKESQPKKDEATKTSKKTFSFLAQIKDGAISLEKLNNLNVPAAQKSVLLVAFYEANNYHRDVILNYLKKLSKDYNDSKEMLAIIKKLMNRIKMQKRFFDIGFYEKILDVLSKISIIKIEQERNGLLALKDNLEVLSSNNIKGR